MNINIKNITHKHQHGLLTSINIRIANYEHRILIYKHTNIIDIASKYEHSITHL
jgi:hypothetical protein